MASSRQCANELVAVADLRCLPWGRAASLAVGIVLVGALIAGLTFLGGCASSATVGALNVLPFPGTPDASPQSQIAFPAVASADVKKVTVQGSQSGNHSGQLSALPDGRGSVFVPGTPFQAGEIVTVNATFDSAGAGTATGAPNKKQVKFTFTVASPPASSPTSTTTATTLASTAASQPAPQPTQSFRSQPDLKPPTVNVSQADATLDPSYMFIDAQIATQNGPMIVDGQGNLVWFKPLPAGSYALDVRVQSYQGSPVLTWWQGQLAASGHGSGDGIIANGAYQTVATVRAGEGYMADAHEFLITSHDTALVTIYQPVQTDLTSVGGTKDGVVLDGIIQEVDIKTGAILWEWHALGHVPLTASEAGKPVAGIPYDFFHINSIEEEADGSLLVSARNTWTVYKISRATGAIIWQLGGKNSSFQMGPGTQFEWQHDARLQPDGMYTLFDNASSPKEESQSRALRLKLDTQTMSATLVTSYTHTPPLLAGSQGNMQVLPSGNVVVDWGDQGDFSEFTSSGQMIFDAKLPGNVQSYRAFRNAWVGQPTDPPSVAVSGSAGYLTVYASWNGATKVASWQVLGGSTPSQLSPVAEAPAKGFETSIAASTSLPYVAVRALDSSGQVLGTSAATSY